MVGHDSVALARSCGNLKRNCLENDVDYGVDKKSYVDTQCVTDNCGQNPFAWYL